MTAWLDFAGNRRERIGQVLAQVLDSPHQEPAHLHNAMRYAVLNGGKRLRPLLVYAAGEALGAQLKQLDLPAAAIELIHAYSLVHDDLPAMDNDDLRRGKPTCHRAFDEATAILAGDALQTKAFQLLADNPALTPQQNLKMISILAAASGSCGMAGGQALDLQLATQSPSLENIEKLYYLKTGALFAAAIELGITAASGADTVSGQALRQYAQYLGLAFQIQDDIHDIEGDVAVLGKLPGNDAKQQKPTYPFVSGLAQAKHRVAALRQSALQVLTECKQPMNLLHQFTMDTLGLNQSNVP